MLRGLNRLAIRVLLISCLTTPAWAADTLYINNQITSSGSAVGQHTYTDSNGTFMASDSGVSIAGYTGSVTNEVFVGFAAPSPGANWQFTFTAPLGQTFAPGNYDNAQLSGGSPVKPEASFFGTPGNSQYLYGCPELQSMRFVIRAITYGSGGSLTSLAVDLQVTCANSGGFLAAAIRYNSSLPVLWPGPTADAGIYQSVMPGATVSVDGSLSQAGTAGPLNSYQWTQLSGPSVSLADPSAVSTTFTAPTVPLGGGDVVLQLQVTDTQSNADASTVTIHVANPSDPITVFSYSSDKGDAVGLGKTASIGPLDYSFTATKFNSGTYAGTVHLDLNGGTFNSWQLYLSPPSGQQLQPGTYDFNAGYGGQSPMQPGFSAYSSSSTFCNSEMTGQFVVWQISYDGSGNVSSLAADFVQHCLGASPALHGKIRYNSSIPLNYSYPISDAGTFQSVMDGSTVSLTSPDSSGGGGTITSYQWTQLSGPLVSLATPGAASTTFTAPIAPPGGVDLVFQLTVTNSLGLTNTDDVTVHVANPGDPASLLYIQSPAGSWVGNGQTFTVNAVQALFTAKIQYGAVEVSADGGAFNWWDLNFEGPGGQALQPGFYLSATRWPFQAANVPGFDVGGDGRGCNLEYGRFHVRQIAYDGSGNVTSLAVDFIQHCEQNYRAPVYGKIRYNSTVPISDPNVNAGRDQGTVEGYPVTLDGSLSNGGGAAVTAYQWTQVSGPAAALVNATSATLSFTAPHVPLGGATLIFQLAVTNANSQTNVDEVQVYVANAADAKTVFYFKSDAGDPVGKGATGLLSAYNNAVGAGVSYYPVGADGSAFDGGSNDWSMQFIPPTGQILQPGTYKIPSQVPTEPGKGSSMLAANGSIFCVVRDGWFTVREAVYNNSFIPGFQHLAIDFVQYCQGSSSALHGYLRYNSAVPIFVPGPIADAGPDQILLQAGTVTLDGSMSGAGSGTIRSYHWRQVSGPSVQLSQADLATTTFVPSKGWFYHGDVKLVFQLTVRDNVGAANSDTVTVYIPAQRTAKTILYYQSDAGDKIGDGQTVLMTSADVNFSAYAESYYGYPQVTGTGVYAYFIGSPGIWQLNFQAPVGKPLAIRNYPSVSLYATNSAGGLEVTGYNNCSTVTGSFTVYDMQLSTGGQLQSFAADFVLHCNGATPALHGMIRINSTVPYR